MKIVKECYKLTSYFPSEERFGLISQIRRAALSVHLNIAEGSSRKSANERKRYFEIARGSVIDVDAALDVAEELFYITKDKTKELENFTISCFKMLTGLLAANSTIHH